MKPGWVKKAAKRMVDSLLERASHGGDKSKRYVSLALRRSSKYKVGLTKSQKMRVCKKCGSFLTPGKNVRVRIAQKPKRTIVSTCLVCGNKARRGMGEKLKKRNYPNPSSL